jgi:dTDP-4-dehydrorhamnose 3,5-epimerase
MEQGKLVYVLSGRVYDVAVDIRIRSPWYGRYVGVFLEPGQALWIPPGFAHGFQALEDTYFLYLVTKEYSPQHERCIKWDDPEIKIEWPIKENVILSEKDRRCPPLKEAEMNFEY